MMYEANRTKSVLIVDDDTNFVESIQALFDEGNIRMLTAPSGRDALDILNNNPIDLLVTDLNMPRMGGYELIAFIAKNSPNIPVFVMTAFATDEIQENIKTLGVTHFFEKPLCIDSFEEKINEVLFSEKATHRLISQEVETVYENNIKQLSKIIELRDPYTAGHQQRVTALSIAIAEEMSLTDTEIQGLRMAGIVHDIGKIAIPIEILTKPGKLSDAEFLLIKSHPTIGADLLRPMDFPWPVAKIVEQHHEAHGGSGYPNGLKGSEILIEAAILSVADAVDAMANHRPYRPARGIDYAMDELALYSDSHFHPDVVVACRSLFIEKHYIHDSL